MCYSNDMKEQRKKLPSDYPQFVFRIHTEAEKIELNELIEEVLKLYRSRQPDTAKLYNKNDIIIEALKKGLASMKMNPSRQSRK
mgnify:CR=1 FL=1